MLTQQVNLALPAIQTVLTVSIIIALFAQLAIIFITEYAMHNAQ